DKIIAMTEERFGEDKAPQAIMLTHGHFENVGGIVELLERWDIPVYAHSLEIQLLTGEKDYPEPDETVEGGMVAKMSPLFPNEAIDLGDRVQALPDDGSVPFYRSFVGCIHLVTQKDIFPYLEKRIGCYLLGMLL